jgi:hypothetical protein
VRVILQGMDLSEGSPSEATLHELATVIEDIYASRYFTYATFCLLLYDHGMHNLPILCSSVTQLHSSPIVMVPGIALTIGDEVHLVWQSRSINLVKIMFVCNRYLVPAFIAVDVARGCRGFFLDRATERLTRSFILL